MTKAQKVQIGSLEAMKILIATLRDNKLKTHIAITAKESGELYHLYFAKIKQG